ncbi:MAG: hypothetical protein ACREPM_16880, partial [Gemmatimonadaceae bacterium]
ASVSPAVRVTGSDGKNLTGVTVHFAANGGSVSNTSSVTDAGGIAGTQWTPAARSSVQQLTASIDGTQLTAVFNAGVTTSLVGHWVGSAGGLAIDFTIGSHILNTSSDSPVSGIGTMQLSTTGAPQQMTVSGTASDGTFAFQLGFTVGTPPFSQPLFISFAGQVQDNDQSLVGSLNGGGVQVVNATVTKK